MSKRATKYDHDDVANGKKRESVKNMKKSILEWFREVFAMLLN